MSKLNDLINEITDVSLRNRITDAMAREKDFGLVFEDHLPERIPLYDFPIEVGSLVMQKSYGTNEIYKVMKIADGVAECSGNEVVKMKLSDLVCVAEYNENVFPYLKKFDCVCNSPDDELWHILIEADNLHALMLLQQLYPGKVDCIYIDPPYNTGAKDWKYTNNYIDSSDSYRHSKWLSMMEKRLKIAKRILNPKNSVMIITIDEKEYLHLGCLLEEMFPEANIQMVCDVIRANGAYRSNEFSRTNEYIFYVIFGDAKIQPQNTNMFEIDEVTKIKNVKSSSLDNEWIELKRRGYNNSRGASPNQFYPIFVNKETGYVKSIGDSMAPKDDKDDVVPPPNCYAKIPLTPDGEERIWSKIPSSSRSLLRNGYLKIKNGKDPNKSIVQYLSTGVVKDIEAGNIVITGHGDQGEVLGYRATGKPRMPKSVWFLKSHNSGSYGSALLKKIIGDHRFIYPKSLYSVRDSIRFFIANNPNAIIVDFFAGSGTTLHAVNLLNAEDGGHRRCILITNNEVSAEEAKTLTNNGINPGDDDWEKYGIARYVTWPRTVCSIVGTDLKGEKLKGNYIGSGIPMSDGFKSNVVYFKLDFVNSHTGDRRNHFYTVLSALWMKSGAIGPCPEQNEAEVPDLLIYPKNKFAVLVSENRIQEFVVDLKNHPEIETFYIVTDSDILLRQLTADLKDKHVYRLHKDYLGNFKINISNDC